jgi:lipid A 3-O-deacylase
MSMKIAPALAGALVASLAVGAFCIPGAQAQERTVDASGFPAKNFPYIDEVRFGALYHQLSGTKGEGGTDINMEILTGKIGKPSGDYLTDYFLRPRLHLGTEINTNGDTSQLYWGFTWDMPLYNRFYLETAFGGAANDGYLDKVPGHTALGCHVMFKEAISIGYHLSEHWDILATADHTSNANLCEHNAGISDAGLRLGYKW